MAASRSRSRLWGKRATFKYRQPFPLPPGKRDYQSCCLFKTFDVESVEGPQPPGSLDVPSSAPNFNGNAGGGGVSEDAFAFLEDLRPSQPPRQQRLAAGAAEQSEFDAPRSPESVSDRALAFKTRLLGASAAAVWRIRIPTCHWNWERRPVDWSMQPPGVGNGAAAGRTARARTAPSRCLSAWPSASSATCRLRRQPRRHRRPPPPPPPPLALPAPGFWRPLPASGHRPGRTLSICDCCGRPLAAGGPASDASTGFTLSLARQAAASAARPPPVPTLDAGTQTVGLLYPSALELRKLEAELQRNCEINQLVHHRCRRSSSSDDKLLAGGQTESSADAVDIPDYCQSVARLLAPSAANT
uniref:Uncharacterized protein n=1 Tax=Macrostomum lignano TaxID=282301 RepID=A0A1I8FFI5_9PLAT